MKKRCKKLDLLSANYCLPQDVAPGLAGTGKPLLLTNKAAGTWSCDECWSSNKPGTHTCASCGTVRDGASASSVTTSGPIPSIPLNKSLSGSGMGLSSANSTSAGMNTQICSGGLGISLSSTSGYGSSLSGGSGSGLSLGGGMKPTSSLTSFLGTSLSSLSSSSSANSISLGGSRLKLGGVMLTATAGEAHDKNSVSQSSVTSRPSLVPLVSLAPGTWSCPSCYVKNKPDTVKCIACEATNPGASLPGGIAGAPFKNSEKPSLSGRLPILKTTPVDCWECSACMVINKPSETACVACTNRRPSPDSKRNQTSSTSSAGESVFVKLGTSTSIGNTGTGLALGQSGSTLSLAKPADDAEKSGTRLTIGQSGLILGQTGGMKLPSLAAGMFGGMPLVSSGMQLPRLTATASASHSQASLIGSSSAGLPTASGRSNLTMPPLRKLHSSGSTTLPATSSGILGSALQATGMVGGKGPIQVGLPSTPASLASSSSQGIAPFNFAVTKSSSTSALQGLTFIPPTFPTTTSAVPTETTAVGTATFTFSGGAGLKPVVSSLSQQPTGLLKPAAASLATEGAKSSLFPLVGSALGEGVSAGLTFGSKTGSQSLSLGGSNLVFGEGMTSSG